MPGPALVESSTAALKSVKHSGFSASSDAPEEKPQPAVASQPSQSPKTTVAPPAPLVPARIKHQIETACGASVRRIQLIQKADKTLLVRLTLAKATSEKAVMEKLAPLPEITQPGVKLELIVPE